MKAVVGLDISYNNTGVCIRTEKKTVLLHIASGKTQHSKSVAFQMYTRVWPKDKENFSEVDLCKIKSAENLSKHIVQQLLYYKKLWGIDEWEFRIEGNLLRARFKWQVASISDMVLINGIVKSYLLKITDNVSVHQATKIKKQFTGYGSGKKANMELKFKSLFPDFDFTGKVDDVIDSFALSYCNFK